MMSDDERLEAQAINEQREGIEDYERETMAVTGYIQGERESFVYDEVTGRYGPPMEAQSFCMASFLNRQAMYAGSTFMPVHVVKLMYAALEWREKPCTCMECIAIVADILG